MMERRTFLGFLASVIAALFAPRHLLEDWREEWHPADFVYSPPKGAVFFTRDPDQPIPPNSGTQKFVIGQYADYYAELDGMIETGPGCTERLQARIDALPEGHPSKVDWWKVSAGYAERKNES